MVADHFALCEISMALPIKKKAIISNNAKLPRLTVTCVREITPEITRDMMMLAIMLKSVK